MEFYKREPFGEEWKQAAYICTLLANSWLKKQDGGKWTAKEFYPCKIIEPVVKQSDEEIEATLTKAIQAVTEKPKKPKKKK